MTKTKEFIALLDTDLITNENETLPNTYSIGLTDLNYDKDSNTLDVTCRRPGLLIGKAGRTLKQVEELLEVTIKIKEKKFK